MRASAEVEPINLREWKPVREVKPGRLFTCGRPGRATFHRAKVVVGNDIIDRWVSGLPKADPLHIVSLLGKKADGYSEFGYYPFRSSAEPGIKPTFQGWLSARYDSRFCVQEFPTTDARGIPAQTLAAATHQISGLLRENYTVLIVDSAGAERTSRVCEALGYEKL